MLFEDFESTKTLSKTTQKIYRGALNRLALMDVDTRAKLISEQKYVVEVLNTIFDEDNDKERHEKRVYLSAIFWALNDEPLRKKKDYYDAFQKAKQNAPRSTPEKKPASE